MTDNPNGKSAKLYALRRSSALREAKDESTKPPQGKAGSKKAKAPTAGKAGGKGTGKAQPVEALLITKREDVSYLSGFTGEDSFLLVGPGWAVLITDGRFGEQARLECPDIEVDVYQQAMSAAIGEQCKKHSLRRIGVQSNDMVLRTHAALGAALAGRHLVPLSDIIGKVRSVKDATEVAAIRRAIAVAQDAFLELIAVGARGIVGLTERQIAARLDYHMCIRGATKPSFDTIVAAGPHSSLPHYRPGDTVVKPDDTVLIDWGAFVDGYCSDLTRVVFAGRIPPKLAEIYAVTASAQQAGMKAVRAGRAAKSADLAARKVIEGAGYGDKFIHGLGHGIGREIHELPGVGRLSKGRLRRGMVVTVEPGIYLPGVGGVRIEDDVLVGENGPEKLSSLPVELSAMTLK